MNKKELKQILEKAVVRTRSDELGVTEHKCPDDTLYRWRKRKVVVRQCPRCKSSLNKKKIQLEA